MRNGENPEVCHAITLKGQPCKKAGTVPVVDALGRDVFLCGAHASAALRSKPETVKNARKTPAAPKSEPTPAPGPKRAPAEPSGPFSAKTIRRQLDRLERRDHKRAERFRAVRAEVVREGAPEGFPENASPEIHETAILAETRHRLLNAPSRYARPDMGEPVAGSFRLEINGERGGVVYSTHAHATEAARELSAGRFRGAVIYVETLGGVPAGAYHLGRRAA